MGPGGAEFRMRRNRTQLGLTLIEVMVAVAIIGVLATATLMTLIGLETRVKHKATVDLLMTLDLALSEYDEVMGEYPNPDDPNVLDQSVKDDEATAGEQWWWMLTQVDRSFQVLERIHAKYTRDQDRDGTIYRSAIDPWGQPIEYTYIQDDDGDYVLLRSSGPNRMFEDPNEVNDDITNLEGQS